MSRNALGKRGVDPSGSRVEETRCQAFQKLLPLAPVRAWALPEPSRVHRRSRRPMQHNGGKDAPPAAHAATAPSPLPADEHPNAAAPVPAYVSAEECAANRAAGMNALQSYQRIR